MSVNPTSVDDPAGNASVVSEMRPALIKYFKRKTGVSGNSTAFFIFAR
jgi:hypothetical protein